MSSTIKVAKQTKEMLVRFAATLQKRYGRRVDLDEAIRHLLLRQEKKPEVLDSIIGSVPMMSTAELYEERRLDEEKSASVPRELYTNVLKVSTGVMGQVFHRR